MQRTALLTGYSGFLGRHVFDALTSSGWKVVLAGRRPPMDGQKATYVHIDLHRPETLAILRDQISADVVVHLASMVAFGAVKDADLLAPNILTTGALAALSMDWNASMLFASSVAVHGVTQERIAADSPIAADTPYGRSKWLGEELVRASGVSHCILRLGGLFGRAGSAHLGLNNAIASAIRGVPPTRVGRGTARRNYLFVKDASDSILAAVEGGVRGTHLLAGPEAVSIGAMLDNICETLCPAHQPLEKAGPEARDQIIERSPSFGAGITFAAALHDIAMEAKACASG